MVDTRTFEGSREEIAEQLQAFPEDQRFRVTPLPLPGEEDSASENEPGLAELFAGRVGRFNFGAANLSQDSGGKFAALIAEKKRCGRL